MTEAEAEKFEGVENHRLHFRVHSDKMNLAPPAAVAEWYKLHSVELGNATSEWPSDWVGVPGKWTPPGPFDDISMAQILEVMEVIRAGATHLEGAPMWSPNKRGESNERWAGNAVMQVLGVSERRAAIMLAAWFSSKVLIVTDCSYKRRNDAKGVMVDDTAMADWRA
jgi:hypothetical protein